MYCNKVVLDTILDHNFNISVKTNTSLTNLSLKTSQTPDCLLQTVCLFEDTFCNVFVHFNKRGLKITKFNFDNPKSSTGLSVSSPIASTKVAINYCTHATDLNDASSCVV